MFYGDIYVKTKDIEIHLDRFEDFKTKLSVAKENKQKLLIFTPIYAQYIHKGKINGIYQLKTIFNCKNKEKIKDSIKNLYLTDDEVVHFKNKVKLWNCTNGTSEIIKVSDKFIALKHSNFKWNESFTLQELYSRDNYRIVFIKNKDKEGELKS